MTWVAGLLLAFHCVSLAYGLSSKSCLVREIGAGLKHTCAITDDLAIKCWGYNEDGVLGSNYDQPSVVRIGDEKAELGDQIRTVKLGTGRLAVQLAVSKKHNCAILDNGQVKCWGYNIYGQLGVGDRRNRGYYAGQMGDELPMVDFGTNRTAMQIAVGMYHSCAILDNNSTKCWGYNGEGLLGTGDTVSYGTNESFMGDQWPAINFGSGRFATQLALGDLFTCVLLNTNELKCWGSNTHGQLGLASSQASFDFSAELPPINLGSNRYATRITTGKRHVCAILDNNETKMLG